MDKDTIYHYSDKKFNEIKSLELQGKADSKWVEYSKTASFFTRPLTKEIVEEYKANGFKRWDVEELYEHRCSVIDNADSFDGPINITSTPEQEEYDKLNWAKFMKRGGIDVNKLDDDSYYNRHEALYESLNDEYSAIRDEAMKDKGYSILPRDWKYSDAIDRINDIFYKKVKDNLINGNKEQYASNIPHVFTKIKAPIVVSSVVKII